MGELTPEPSTVDHDLKPMLSGVRIWFLWALAVALVAAVALAARLPHGPHPYGDGICRVTRNVGECIIP